MSWHKEQWRAFGNKIKTWIVENPWPCAVIVAAIFGIVIGAIFL